MTSIVKLERDDTADFGNDAQWKETLKAISMLEGYHFTTWGTDLEQPNLVVLMVGWHERPPDTFTKPNLPEHDIFAAIRHRLTSKPPIHSLFLPGRIRPTHWFHCKLREITILEGSSSNLSSKLLDGSWELMGQMTSLTGCSDGWDEVPGLTQGWVLASELDDKRTMIQMWDWGDVERMHRIKNASQEDTGSGPLYRSLVKSFLDDAVASGVAVQSLMVKLSPLMIVDSERRHPRKKVKKLSCIVQ